MVRCSAATLIQIVLLGLALGTCVCAAAQIPITGNPPHFQPQSVQSPVEWAWMGGSKTVPTTCVAGNGSCGQPGVYGAEFRFAATNSPGARNQSASWSDQNGRLWLFGGTGYDSRGNYGTPNDLWVFDPSEGAHGEWAWMGGSQLVPACSAGPASGLCGPFGVYGTEYQFAAANIPGGRSAPAFWAGSDGRFWLFGGWGIDSAGNVGLLNDLWVFDPLQGSHGEWAWMGGSKTIPASCLIQNGCGPNGVYGVEYQFSATNIPGGRTETIGWTDARGRFWLFGGVGWGSTGPDGLGYLNDVWVFDATTGTHGQWGWMGGSDSVPTSCNTGIATCGQPGVYGTEFAFAATNIPGGRTSPVIWIDQSHKIWLFGGTGSDSAGTSGGLNDLWVFDPTLGTDGEWSWMSGSKTVGTSCPRGVGSCEQPGAYGTKYQFAPTNIPGDHTGSVTWTDREGKLWLLGGSGTGSMGDSGDLNDIWVFDPARGSHGEWAWMGGSTAPNPFGDYGTEYQFAATNIPGGRVLPVVWTDRNGDVWLFGGYGYDSVGNAGSLNDLWSFRLGDAKPLNAGPHSAQSIR